MLEIVEVKNRYACERLERLADVIWRECYADILSGAQIDYMLTHFQSADALERQIAEGYRYFFVRDNGAAYGYFAVKPTDDDFFISKLYILHLARGKGIGKTCMSYIEEIARRSPCKRLTLTVNKKNAAAIAAYEKMGFSTYDEGVVDIGGGFKMDDFYMEKGL